MGEPHRTHPPPHIAHRVHCRVLFYLIVCNYKIYKLSWEELGMLNNIKWHKIYGLSETVVNGDFYKKNISDCFISPSYLRKFRKSNVYKYFYKGLLISFWRFSSPNPLLYKMIIWFKKNLSNRKGYQTKQTPCKVLHKLKRW